MPLYLAGELLGRTIRSILLSQHLDRLNAATVEERARRAEEEAARLAQEAFANSLKLEHARATRAADSRLNHVFKGKCGAARMNIELATSLRPVTDHQATLLHEAIALLDQAVEWLHRRQV